MAGKDDEFQRPGFPNGHPTSDDLLKGLLVAADRAIASGNREIAIILINEIFKVIDGLK